MKQKQFIPVQKKRFSFFLVLGIVLIVTGLIGFTVFSCYDSINYLLTRGSGALALIGAFVLVVSLINIFNKSKGVVLDEEGISLNAGVVKGRALWSNVRSLDERSYLGQTFIVMLLDNNEDFIAQLSRLQKFAASQNFKNLGSPLAINVTMLDADKEKLKTIISDYFS